MSAILMHRWRNRQNHVLVFAGTGEGPVIAGALLESGHRVSISVVSAAGARSYSAMPLHDLHVGAFPSQDSLEEHLTALGVTFVLDATHPFALQISAQLRMACSILNLPLLRFERPDHDVSDGSVLSTVGDLSDCALSGHRLLLAVGARQLASAAAAARLAGASVHARVLPTPEAIRQAGLAGLFGERLAVLRPGTGYRTGGLEAALCRRWQITDVLCRQSGGAADQLWSDLARRHSIRLWKLKRPNPMPNVDVVHSVSQLCRQLNDHVNGPETGPHHGG
ncbi:precorrin-6x reductase [Synechococcus sp. BIOS-E4-1]|uniref:precorrin-6A/cobalt-precorrin-6A reductase n=1 Tax=Synechococcus sp. BIOS-E4-1 TaxID=1400864 RepID=UPI0016464442|nr:precorrin-6A/cobalt-precorrin-6A reductase [Synechococcus sp. BIOS-E4-1]QNI55755.1 precorrin-6x reductase [Synechococcus sp. BIOS-E4-1]